MMDSDGKAAVVIVVVIACIAGGIAFLTHDGISNEPTNPDTAAALAGAVHGGPLPGSYKPMQATITAVNHSVEPSQGTDVHIINASIARSGKSVYADVLLITSAGALYESCSSAWYRLKPGVVVTVSGCWALPPGEEPLGAVVTASTKYPILPNEYEALPLPLFGAPTPPGLKCEASDDGTVCAWAGQ